MNEAIKFLTKNNFFTKTINLINKINVEQTETRLKL